MSLRLNLMLRVALSPIIVMSLIYVNLMLLVFNISHAATTIITLDELNNQPVANIRVVLHNYKTYKVTGDDGKVEFNTSKSKKSTLSLSYQNNYGYQIINTYIDAPLKDGIYYFKVSQSHQFDRSQCDKTIPTIVATNFAAGTSTAGISPLTEEPYKVNENGELNTNEEIICKHQTQNNGKVSLLVHGYDESYINSSFGFLLDETIGINSSIDIRSDNLYTTLAYETIPAITPTRLMLTAKYNNVEYTLYEWLGASELYTSGTFPLANEFPADYYNIYASSKSKYNTTVYTEQHTTILPGTVALHFPTVKNGAAYYNQDTNIINWTNSVTSSIDYTSFKLTHKKYFNSAAISWTVAQPNDATYFPIGKKLKELNELLNISLPSSDKWCGKIEETNQSNVYGYDDWFTTHSKNETADTYRDYSIEGSNRNISGMCST